MRVQRSSPSQADISLRVPPTSSGRFSTRKRQGIFVLTTWGVLGCEPEVRRRVRGGMTSRPGRWYKVQPFEV